MSSVIGENRYSIGLARFNNTTFEENKRWRENNNWKGCIYTPRKPISLKIPINSLIIVIEMNNEQNKIMGFGLIRNYRHPKQRIFIYSGNWKSEGKPYHSDRRIDISEVKEEDKEIIISIEQRLFYGCNHYKRSPSQINTIDIKKFSEPTKVNNFLSNLFITN